MAAYIDKHYGTELLGITCVAGNTTLPNVVVNALISQKIAGLKVPVFKGTICSYLGATNNILGKPII
jgi:inosine-uridine nucleoside N-ribohydrolase